MNWIVKSQEKINFGAIMLSLNEGNNIVGRGHNCNLIVNSVLVSRKHCSLVLKQGKVYVLDHQSFNGTYIGDMKILPAREMELKDGDLIGIGINPHGYYPDHPEVTRCIFQVSRLPSDDDSKACNETTEESKTDLLRDHSETSSFRNVTVDAPPALKQGTISINEEKMENNLNLLNGFIRDNLESPLPDSTTSVPCISPQKEDSCNFSTTLPEAAVIVKPDSSVSVPRSSPCLSSYKHSDAELEVDSKNNSASRECSDELIDLTNEDENSVDRSSRNDMDYSQIEDDVIELSDSEDDKKFNFSIQQISDSKPKVEVTELLADDDEAFEGVEVFDVYDMEKKCDEKNIEKSLESAFGEELNNEKDLFVDRKENQCTQDVIMDLMSQEEVEKPKSKRKCDEGTVNSLSKKLKIEVIEALPNRTTRKSKSPKTKKPKKSKTPPPADLNALRPSQKKKIREARKVKLKEIAEKDRQNQNSSVKIPAEANAKVTSCTRSETLMQEIVQAEKPTYKQTKVSATNKKSTKELNKLVSTVLKKPQQRQEKKLRFAEEGALESVKTYVVSQESQEPKEQPTTQNEVIHLVCRWNPKWIKESLKTSTLPPLLEECHLAVIPQAHDSYDSYSDYQRTMFPLLIYEMWENIIKDSSGRPSETMTACVEDIKVSSLSEKGSKRSLLMDSIIVQLLFGGYNSPKSGDLVVLKVSSYGSEGIAHVVFGYVSETMRRTNLQHASAAAKNMYRQFRSQYPDDKQVFCLSLKILVRQRKVRIWNIGTYIGIEVLANLAKDLRLFGCLGRVMTSPLNSIIFRPLSACVNSDIGNSNLVDESLKNLNSEQLRAVKYCSEMPFIDEEAIALIHGPPGTGKSITITHIIKQMIRSSWTASKKDKFRILLCCSSNFAVDELVDKLLTIRESMPPEERLKIVRVGKNEMMMSRAKTVSLDTLTQRRISVLTSDKTLAKKYLGELTSKEKWLTALIDKNGKAGSAYNMLVQETVELRREIKDITELMNGTACENRMLNERLSHFIEREVLHKCDVIASTLSSACSVQLRQAFMNKGGQLWGKPFAVCIIDEASQAIELQALSPILLSVDKFILVGDHCQLSPVVTSNAAKEGGLGLSLFERIMKAYSSNPSAFPIFSLTTQYRMHPEILRFPNKKFYSNSLQTEPSLRFNDYLVPYYVFSHSHAQKKTEDSNPQEARIVLKLLEALLECEHCEGLSISVISPYQAHRSLLSNQIHQLGLGKDRVVVQTADSAQGQERDIVIVSVGKSTGVGFLSDPHRLNVMLTRARSALYLVANLHHIIKGSPMWRELEADARDRKLLSSVSSKTTVDRIKQMITSK